MWGGLYCIDEEFKKSEFCPHCKRYIVKKRNINFHTDLHKQLKDRADDLKKHLRFCKVYRSTHPRADNQFKREKYKRREERKLLGIKKKKRKCRRKKRNPFNDNDNDNDN